MTIRNTILAAVIAVAPLTANAYGYAYGAGATGSEASAGSTSYGVVVGSGYALEASDTGAWNSSGVHIDATGGPAHGVDLDTYSYGGTYSDNAGAVGGSAFGYTAGAAYQDGYGYAYGYAFDYAP